MAFRNYDKTKTLCLDENSPSDLDIKIDALQADYDIIDLQFSTHFDNTWKQPRYCALLLLSKKESK